MYIYNDPSSPTLFALYVINDLVDVFNAANGGLTCGNQSVCARFYADDIVIFSESPQIGIQHS